ncbi:hypothetical protein PV08_11105 [Exophiala spinifera]|uniref:Uncharacterized protein n=1 Tax=Exophiala spinifera TaxID=91928 RepID=A0A0D2BFK6_9EURO|nr:uncharacterized protein PV08_11105 [Exophiala spinifera]KIW10144.1 hypothetical protein PV08_11105 [Exophiala spinifera]
MKLSNLGIGTGLLSVLGLTQAQTSGVWLEWSHRDVHPNHTYEIGWEIKRNYTLQLLLVKQFDGGWTGEDLIWKDQEGTPPGGSYNWTVPSEYEPGANYGLWLYGENVPFDGEGYANLTEWFQISDEEQ